MVVGRTNEGEMLVLGKYLSSTRTPRPPQLVMTIFYNNCTVSKVISFVPKDGYRTRNEKLNSQV